MPWRPAHETHAIERVNLTLTFAEPVPSKIWQPLVEDATARFFSGGFEQVPPALNAPFNLGPPQFVIGGGGAPPPMFFGMNSGNLDRAFTLAEAGEAREEASIFRQQITYVANRYGGWLEVGDRLRTTLQPLIDGSFKVVSPHTLKLEYWDRFFFEGPAEQLNYRELLSPTSKYVSAFYLETQQQFHSHIGLFTTPMPQRRLLNANIDVVDVALPDAESGEARPQRSAGVYTMVQDLFVPPIPELDFDSVLGRADELHTLLKEVLGDIITDQMASRISLFPKVDA